MEEGEPSSARGWAGLRGRRTRPHKGKSSLTAEGPVNGLETPATDQTVDSHWFLGRLLGFKKKAARN